MCGGLEDTGAGLCAAVGNLEVSQEVGKDCMFQNTGMEWWSGQAHPHWVVGGVRADRRSLLEAGAVNKQVPRSGSREESQVHQQPRLGRDSRTGCVRRRVAMELETFDEWSVWERDLFSGTQ